MSQSIRVARLMFDGERLTNLHEEYVTSMVALLAHAELATEHETDP